MATRTIVSRYTNLASALEVLMTRRFTLLDPSTWSDRNDRACLEAYKRRIGAECVRALCLTYASETSHHWSAYAGGADGVRLELDAEQLEADSRSAGAVLRKVKYQKLSSFDPAWTLDDDIPFVKRWPFRDECEVRLLWVGNVAGETGPAYVPLTEGTLKRVVLSPMLHPDLVEAVKRALKQDEVPSRRPRVHRSTLLGNDQWIGRLRDPAG